MYVHTRERDIRPGFDGDKIKCYYYCYYSFTQSQTQTVFQVTINVSSRFRVSWLGGFLILYMHVLYSMYTHTGISGLPLYHYVQVSECVYPFLFLCVILNNYQNMHIRLQLSLVSVVPECVYSSVFTLVFRVIKTCIAAYSYHR